jgi:hypothetical protein
MNGLALSDERVGVDGMPHELSSRSTDHREGSGATSAPYRYPEQLTPMTDTISTAMAAPPGERNLLTAEQVAGLVAGIPVIGEACAALRKAGWRASIAGNRITVNDEVFAQFIGATVAAPGRVDARWVVYEMAGTPPMWVVGAEPRP